MLKKTISLILVVILALGMASVAMGASEFVIKDGVLTDYLGAGGDVVIPTGVTAIGNSAFGLCENLVSITLPSTVVTIEEFAFFGCSRLSSVVIPEGVTDIGRMAFAQCESLASITIPSTVSYIGSEAFSFCDKLENVTISGQGLSVGADIFSGSDNIKSVIIIPGVIGIESRAYSSCDSLESIVIPSTVTTIQGKIFSSRAPVLLHVAPNSTAEMYAQEQGLSYVTDQPYVDTASHSVDPQSAMAYPSTQTVSLYGKPVVFQMYALRDENGNMTNYIKLRDLAYAVQSDPDCQNDLGMGALGLKTFQVEWNGAITVTTNMNYTANGSEMQTPFSGERVCVHAPTDILLKNGTFINLNYSEIHTLDSLQIQDDQGNGYTYFKLRDLGDLLSESVRWDAQHGIAFGW